ncbi:hypothetical protein LPJ66_002694 [Kickxella alabastrina]|uniref:Uncharacterized protein n=1 Tax=Kickxella alabastrina TaxID=61397 RepID=A0ACC1IPQ9_9FUNG|nr:hypothetical protein LPJ66_002694 [Kickxella alabastrina]
MDTVVDLTDSPTSPPPLNSAHSPLTTHPNNTHNEYAGPVVISSDEEAAAEGIRAQGRMPAGVPPLPQGYILPPIRPPNERSHGRIERITTLRQMLMPGRSGNRNTRSNGSNAQGQPQQQVLLGSNRVVPLHMTRPPIISRGVQHMANDPIQPGVYNPIHARPLLPHERQQRIAEAAAAAGAGAGAGADSPLSSAVIAGRETADGAIDVEDVDPTPYNQMAAAASANRSYVSSSDDLSSEYSGNESPRNSIPARTIRPFVGRRYRDAEDRQAAMQLIREARARQQAQSINHSARGEMEIQRRYRSQRNRQLNEARAAQRRNRPSSGQNATGTSIPFMFPFHPGLLPHHFQRNATNGSGNSTNRTQLNPFDFFPGEDISDLLTFLEATAPQPPSNTARPRPLSPVQLTKQQAELAKTPDFSRCVPACNYRDTLPADIAAATASKALEIVCAQCTGTLFDKEPVWAPRCGHVMCNTCYKDITAGSRACKVCRHRMHKNKLVHLFT